MTSPTVPDASSKSIEAPVSERPAQIRAAHLGKFVLVYVRQSSPDQVREHTGSTAAQRALAELPLRWGWPESRIRIIDEDLGRSGTSSSRRAGFLHMLDLIDRGEVGLVMVRDVSRLSRDPLDAEVFLTKAIRASVLIAANGRIFDTATEDLAELFGIRIQSLLAWFENRSRTRSMQAAKAAKVRQGGAVSRPPIGYVQSVRGKWIKDPDPKVPAAVRLVVDLFLVHRSIGRVVRHMRQHHLLFPRRKRSETTWHPVTRPQVGAILTNPNYLADYIFRRHTVTEGSKDYPRRVQRCAPSDWIVHKDHHDAYMTPAEWDVIQSTLAAHRPTVRPPICKGHALLQGLVWCGSCNRWMHTRYPSRQAKGTGRLATYACLRRDQWGNVLHSRFCSAYLLDPRVIDAVLSALTPTNMDTALGVVREAQAEQLSIQQAHLRHLHSAEAEVAEARRRYYAVDPQNRLVKTDLEARLEEAIHRLDNLKAHARGLTAVRSVSVTASDVAELVSLTHNIRALWSAPTTTNEDRKQLLRAVVSRVVIDFSKNEAVDVTIVWAGGLQESLRVLRPAGVDQLILEHSRSGKTPQRIVEELRAAGVNSVRGMPMSRAGVYDALSRLGVSPLAERPQCLHLIRKLLVEGRPRSDIRKSLEREWPHLGPWTAQRLSNSVATLRRGAYRIPPWPSVSSPPGSTSSEKRSRRRTASVQLELPVVDTPPNGVRATPPGRGAL